MRVLSVLGVASLFGLVLSSPARRYQKLPSTAPRYPKKSYSKGFMLVVNVTDPATDFDPPIHNSYITSFHTGAGQGLVGIVNANGRVFYQNGTDKEVREHRSNIISDGGTPIAPQGFQLTQDEYDETISAATLNFGPGSAGVFISSYPEPYAYLMPETFIACDEKLPYYGGRKAITIKRSTATVEDGGFSYHNIPDECIAVRLIPQCTELGGCPKDATSSHQYAIHSGCYDDVASIKWPIYASE
ncbi:hypothetical protein S7711_01442 [Stachybotrys chartarum IBT 7711]|uniref:DUF7907 domain-containing protein n=1 Tax=Stachybotrys chartarum (strain CBS 109288 / IBT 7711) TaxID=1280523 RepID=A0A084B6Z8_STACB|nr:hypothetical protein S7711_01442 [Stachybotrys chartarum IBT 7711]KFA55032.1 hypothetical protein S40293_03536 [Stachybotrys chartarum IBT 40293]KFA77710.1 hypothetical protein S40288_00434 [Stachybotrys chartarum IBT 40288]